MFLARKKSSQKPERARRLNNSTDPAEHRQRPITERRLARMREVLERRHDDLVVVLENIHDAHNASAILRSCDAFGVGRIALVYNNQEFPEISGGVAAKVEKWLQIDRYESAEECVSELRSEGIRVYATAADRGRAGLSQRRLQRPIGNRAGQRTCRLLGRDARVGRRRDDRSHGGIRAVPQRVRGCGRHPLRDGAAASRRSTRLDSAQSGTRTVLDRPRVVATR